MGQLSNCTEAQLKSILSGRFDDPYRRADSGNSQVIQESWHIWNRPEKNAFNSILAKLLGKNGLTAHN